MEKEKMTERPAAGKRSLFGINVEALRQMKVERKLSYTFNKNLMRDEGTDVLCGKDECKTKGRRAQ